MHSVISINVQNQSVFDIESFTALKVTSFPIKKCERVCNKYKPFSIFFMVTIEPSNHATLL